MKRKVVVVLVTYNRRKCLSVVLNAIEKQTFPISGILIVDNKSTDDTQEFLYQRGFMKKVDECVLQKNLSDKGIEQFYYRNNKNVGGAGGFAKAIELVSNIPADFVWIMDDDVEPKEDCLEKLLSHMSDKVKACIPNRTDEYFQDHACLNIDMKSLIKYKITKRKTFAELPLSKGWYSVKDMPFEGPLISKEIIKKVGLPNSGFFIEYDDTDYATRILKYTEIYFVTDSCLHRQLAKESALSTKKKSWKYTWRNYYSIRNNILFNHKYAETWRARHLSTGLIWGWHILRSLYRREFKNIAIINKAVKDGIKNKYGMTVLPGEF